MEYEVSVDRQGRMTIPAPLRRLLNLDGGGRVVVSYENGVLVIRVVDRDLKKRVRKWVGEVLSVSPKPLIEEYEGDSTDRWVSVEYARRKLGTS